MPVTWRLAKSLITLRDQVDGAWPNRNKASDGTIGDASHAAVQSEHNPNSSGVVTAIDITQDPSSGADMQALADALTSSNDDRIWYIIFNRRIWYPTVGWKPYSGTSDPHTNHLHLSVNQNPYSYDDPRQWKIKQGVSNMPTLTTAGNLEDLTLMATGRSSSGDPNLKNLIGQDLEETIRYFLKLPEHLALLDRAAASGDAEFEPLNQQLYIKKKGKQ